MSSKYTQYIVRIIPKPVKSLFEGVMSAAEVKVEPASSPATGKPPKTELSSNSQRRAGGGANQGGGNRGPGERGGGLGFRGHGGGRGRGGGGGGRTGSGGGFGSRDGSQNRESGGRGMSFFNNY